MTLVMTRLIDICGLRFGRLLVISRAKNSDRACWNCICDCGNTKVVTGKSLRNGDSSSCGCYRREVATVRMRAMSTKHGCSRKNGTYNSWAGMKARCNNPLEPSYPHYGGRGIKVCSRWLDSF